MVWGALALIVIAIVLAVVQYYITPKPKIENARPAGLGDFQVPTATEKRSVPVVWGDVIVRGPNVIWYGDYATKPYRQTEGGNKITLGHFYYLGMDMAICHGSDDLEMYQVDIKDKKDVFDGTVMSGVNTYTLDKPDLFGGKAKAGGVEGTLEFYQGDNTAGNAETSQYMADQVAGGDKNEMPAYPNLCHVVWRGPSSGVNTLGRTNGLLGKSTRIDNWAFYVRRYPLPSAMTIGLGNERIGDDANPICALFEVLTDQVWGAGLPITELDIPAFNVAADRMATDGLGFSMIWATKAPIRNLVKEIMRIADGAFYQTSDGKMTLNLARNDAPIMTLDETNIIEMRKFSRNAWNQTLNHIQIDYVDRDLSFKETSAAAQDLANFRLQGGIDMSSAQTYPGVKDKETAKWIASRNLRQFSYPLALIEIEANREASSLKPGDVVTMNWPELGITGMVVRIMQLGLGELDGGGVILYGTEDVFGLGGTAFSAPPQTNWNPVIVAPVDLVVKLIDEVPQILAGVGEEWSGDTLDTDFRLMGLGENPGNGDEYTVHSRTDATADPFVAWDPSEFPNTEANPQFLGYTPTAGLSSVLHGYQGGSDTITALTVGGLSIDFLDLTGLDDPDISPAGVKTMSLGDIQAGKSLILMGSEGGRQEYLAYTTLTDNGDGTVTLGTLYRGLLDTAPWTWPVGEKLWFVSEPVQISQSVPPVASEQRSTRRVSPALPVNRTLDARIAQESQTGVLAVVDAAELNPSIPTLANQPRQARPAAVGEVGIQVAVAAAGAGLGAATVEYTPDSSSLVSGATRNTLSGVTGSFDLRVSIAARDRVDTSVWLPGDGNTVQTEVTTYAGDPFTAGAGVSPFRRAAVLVEGIDGGVTTLASGDIDLATATSIDFLALPDDVTSNANIIRITITTERHESGVSVFDSAMPYVAVFERVV